jgi:CTP:molybdopterin cytidylyltransferase MocA/SAM-dependent methyltransferase
MTSAARSAAIVLAGGAASRFGSDKLLSRLAGRPILDRVLDAVRAAGVAQTVVVLGDHADVAERTIAWAGERRVRNPDPGRGLSSSLQVGFAAIAGVPDLDAAFVILGDQPLLDPAVLRALLAAEVPAGRALVVPRYLGGGGANPVLVLRAGWPLVEQATGDRGLGPILAAHPDLVLHVDLGGTNPDVDTPADLAELDWAVRVREDRAQVDRHREVRDDADFYGPVSSLFRADPQRTDDSSLERLRGLARPGETWLDIGAGAGRYALPLALLVREVIAVDPSDGMLAALQELMAEHGIANIRVVSDRWPPTAGSPADGLRADVALIAHLGYDIEAIGPFVEAMEGSATRLCVAVLQARQPSSIADPFWPLIHGEERIALPALDAFVALLRARGRTPTVAIEERAPRGFATLDELHGFVRRQLWLAEGGPKDRHLATLVRERAQVRDGRWYLETRSLPAGVVTWAAVERPGASR